jgi:hypothetical protein
LAVAFAGAALWHFADRGVAFGPALRDAVLDLDARVALEPSSACEPRVASWSALAAGAAPRLDAAARFVWFEARAADGRRQVHRYERATRGLACLTCAEPGENRRPAPHPTARAVVFDTDRFASWRRPFDRELMVLATDGVARPSRRLTWDAARDTAPLYDPSGLGIAWSRRTLAGRAVRAPIRLGHGSLSLGRTELLARGGFAEVSPIAWSPDARALALARGAPPPHSVELVDYATRSARTLPPASAFAASISFSADGSQLARAERAEHGTSVRRGPTSGGGSEEIALGELATWGEPTGIALAPAADAFALGQRSATGEERIVWAQLTCPRGPAVK